MAKLFGLGIELRTKRTNLGLCKSLHAHLRKDAFHLACTNAGDERFLDDRNQGPFATTKLVDNRWSEVIIAGARNLKVERPGTCVKATGPATVTQVAALICSFVWLSADMASNWPPAHLPLPPSRP